MEGYCGTNCDLCEMNDKCGGCKKTKGKPFGGDCMISKCCLSKSFTKCENCKDNCLIKNELISEFNQLNISGMPKIKTLNALMGLFVNMEYFINGQKIKVLDDNKIYLGNQVLKKGTNRCYGLAGDEKYLLVCEYGENGENPEIIIFKKRDNV